MSENRTGATGWDMVAAAGGVAAVVMLVLVLVGGIFVDEGELKAELKATEDRITSVIRDSTAQTNAQMKELRGYIVGHFDGHPNDGNPTN